MKGAPKIRLLLNRQHCKEIRNCMLFPLVINERFRETYWRDLKTNTAEINKSVEHETRNKTMVFIHVTISHQYAVHPENKTQTQTCIDMKSHDSASVRQQPIYAWEWTLCVNKWNRTKLCLMENLGAEKIETVWQTPLGVWQTVIRSKNIKHKEKMSAFRWNWSIRPHNST